MQSRPNILFIQTDQQRADTIAALGNSIIKTPALDSLVKEGTTFTRCYTSSPVCVPARCSIATGLPPHLTGCTDNGAMPQNIPSFMEKLSDLGYQTHGTGKMHFTPNHKRLWGFDGRDISEENIPYDDYKEFLDQNGYNHIIDTNGLRGEYYYLPQPSQMPAELHQTHWVGDRSIDFLKGRNRDEPFFLWTSFIKPHPPFDNPTPWNKLYRTYEMDGPFLPENHKDLLTFWNRYQNRYKYTEDNQSDYFFRTMRAAYYACLSFIDSQIGRILEQLGDEIDNTLILFSSDHGELLGDYGSVGKRSMLEPAARVPLIARYPKKFQAGDLCSKPVSLLDLYPTFLKTAGCKDYRVSDEGDDLSDIATDKIDRQHTFSQFSSGKTGLYLITDDRFKYSYSAADEKEWLIDLKTDPQETQNIVSDTTYEADKNRLKNTLISRFEKDNYTEAVQQGDWKDYGGCHLPLENNPNFGLLQQDISNTQELVDQLGPYARNISIPDEGSYKEAQKIIATKNKE